MTSPYRRRLARTFHRLARQHPDLPLRQLFQMCHRQTLEDQIAELLDEIHRLTIRYHLNVIRQSPRTGARRPHLRHTEQRITHLTTQVAVLTARRHRISPIRHAAMGPPGDRAG